MTLVSPKQKDPQNAIIMISTPLTIMLEPAEL
jgi:hypothetical protein